MARTRPFAHDPRWVNAYRFHGCTADQYCDECAESVELYGPMPTETWVRDRVNERWWWSLSPTQQYIEWQRRSWPAFKRQWWPAILERDEYACVQCGATGDEAELEPDHIVPLCQGGQHAVENLRVLCVRCNRSKASRDRVTGRGATG